MAMHASKLKNLACRAPSSGTAPCCKACRMPVLGVCVLWASPPPALMPRVGSWVLRVKSPVIPFGRTPLHVEIVGTAPMPRRLLQSDCSNRPAKSRFDSLIATGRLPHSSRLGDGQTTEPGYCTKPARGWTNTGRLQTASAWSSCSRRSGLPQPAATVHARRCPHLVPPALNMALQQ